MWLMLSLIFPGPYESLSLLNAVVSCCMPMPGCYSHVNKQANSIRMPCSHLCLLCLKIDSSLIDNISATDSTASTSASYLPPVLSPRSTRSVSSSEKSSPPKDKTVQSNRIKQDTIREGKTPHIKVKLGNTNPVGGKEFHEQVQESEIRLFLLLGVASSKQP